MRSQSYMWPLGRFLIAFIFVVSGIGKIASWGATAAYMSSKGLPFAPLLLFIATVAEIVCGVCIMIGYRSSLNAVILAVYLVPVTLTFHDFWMYSGAEGQMQMVNFLKNLSIMGGLLTLGALRSTPVSVDQVRLRRHPSAPTPSAA